MNTTIHASARSQEAHLFGYTFASPVDAIIRPVVPVRLGHEDMKPLAPRASLGISLSTRLFHYPAHLREMRRVAPHAVDEDEQVDALGVVGVDLGARHGRLGEDCRVMVYRAGQGRTESLWRAGRDGQEK